MMKRLIEQTNKNEVKWEKSGLDEYTFHPYAESLFCKLGFVTRPTSLFLKVEHYASGDTVLFPSPYGDDLETISLIYNAAENQYLNGNRNDSSEKA